MAPGDFGDVDGGPQKRACELERALGAAESACLLSTFMAQPRQHSVILPVTNMEDSRVGKITQSVCIGYPLALDVVLSA